MSNKPEQNRLIRFITENKTYCIAVEASGLLFMAYLFGILQLLPLLTGLLAHASNFLGSAFLVAVFTGPKNFRQAGSRWPYYVFMAVAAINFALELAPPIGHVALVNGGGIDNFNFPDILDAVAGALGAAVMLLVIWLRRHRNADSHE